MSRIYFLVPRVFLNLAKFNAIRCWGSCAGYGGHGEHSVGEVFAEVFAKMVVVL